MDQCAGIIPSGLHMDVLQSRSLRQGTSPARVVILMCTHNGARFLAQQLDSIAAQTYPHWRMVVSDDGSTDGTIALLRAFAERPISKGRIDVRNGPKQGATANFLSLATDAGIESEYFAYCDQDDIWFREKLERAVTWLAVHDDVPALYCTRTVLTNAQGRSLGRSPRFGKAPSFRNALVQNVGGGNTMVFNQRARALLIAAVPCDIVCYDWWTYMLVSGAGGLVHYEPLPAVAYRQHSNNQIGSNKGFAAALKRFKMLLLGEWVAWNDRNSAALIKNAFLLSSENRELLKAFYTMRKGTLVQRLRTWWQIGLYRQTLLGQLTLLFATIFRRL